MDSQGQLRMSKQMAGERLWLKPKASVPPQPHPEILVGCNLNMIFSLEFT